MSSTGRHYQHHPFAHSTNKYMRQRHSHAKRKMPLQHPIIGDYWLGKTIGRGASGRVKTAIHRDTGEQVAIKMIARSRLSQSANMASCVQRELAMLHLLNHPHVVRLRQVLQDSNHVYFVMDYVDGGELYHALTEHGRLPESKARHLFAQLASGLAWCHSHHICHRDLKPENLLLDKTHENLKIVDFGMATIQSPDWLLKTSCGSPHYASPEIVRGKPYNGYATDVWSAGVILYAMLTGRLPFDGSHAGSLLSKIKSGRYLPLPSHVSQDAKDLIKRMLTVNPSKRITIQDVLLHPWVTDISCGDMGRPYGDQQARYPSSPSPLPHDHVMHGSGIGSQHATDVDSRTWEMLKVLWRNYSQKELLAALTSDSPNVPKLTRHLLQQRVWREEADNASATPTWAPLYRPYSCSSSCSTITHDSGISCCGGGAAGTAAGVGGPLMPDTDTTLYFSSPEPHAGVANTPSTPSSSTSSLAYATPTSTNPTLSRWLEYESSSSTAHPLVAQFAHVHSVLEPHTDTSLSSSSYSAAEQHLLRLQQTSSSSFSLVRTTCTFADRPWKMVSSWLGVARDWCAERLADREQTVHAHANKVYVLERPAKSEREAAGKLHQILREHFNGTLQGRVYQNDKVIWDGVMESSGQVMHFMCHISSASAPKGKTKVGFVLVKGDQAPMDLGMDRLLQMWNRYEQDAKAVIMANGWFNGHQGNNSSPPHPRLYKYISKK